MPNIESAKKRMRQSEKRRKRNYTFRARLKTEMKKVIHLAQEGKKDEAENYLKVAYSVIDTARKKHILHGKNAARKKSRMARVVSLSLAAKK